MTQRLFNSFRKLPGFKKKSDSTDTTGEHYRINQCGDFGFPSKPSVLAYDPVLDIIALATKSGKIKVFGKPGVHYFGNQQPDADVCKLAFIPGLHHLITVTGTNSVRLWQLGSPGSGPRLTEIAHIDNVTSVLPAKVGYGGDSGGGSSPALNVTTVCVTRDCGSLLLGTEGGAVVWMRLHARRLAEMESSSGAMWSAPNPEEVIDTGRLSRCIPAEHRDKISFGAVVVLSERPGQRGHYLIGYQSGSCVIYDASTDTVVALLPCQRELESASWAGCETAATVRREVGQRLMTCHSDGSLAVWGIIDGQLVTSMEDPAIMPYGPFPCKSITRVFWRPLERSHLTVFAGGMPRSTYGDRQTVTIQESERRPSDPDADKHVCFDLTSPLVDLLMIGGGGSTGSSSTSCLLMLCEEELLVVDLQSTGWPLLHLPYLNCLHAASITATAFVTQVGPELLTHLETLSTNQQPTFCGVGGRYSPRPWPIQGIGRSSNNNNNSITSEAGMESVEAASPDLLITGHQDGSVTLWRLGAGACLRRLTTVYTGTLLDGEFARGPTDPRVSGGANDDEADEWPPFTKVGVFDPYTDDVRGAATVVQMVKDQLIVGGAAGQVSLWRVAGEPNRHPVEPVRIDIITELPGFQWKGHAPLQVRPDLSSVCSGGLLANSLLLLAPPARITSLAYHANLHLLAAGTPHGLVLADLQLGRTLFVRSTLPSNPGASEEASVGEGWARRRTREIKRSLRDSFRRLKRMRSTRSGGLARSATEHHPGPSHQYSGDPLEDPATAPAPSVEREIEARSTESASGALVRTLLFASVHLRIPGGAGGRQQCVVLLVGTASGIMLVCAVVAEGERVTWRAVLAKQMQLQHKAPILHLGLIDAKTFWPIDSATKCDLLVVSEEQVRLFSLPDLRLRHKARITAEDGFRIKMAATIVHKATGVDAQGAALGAGEDIRVCRLVFTNAGGQVVVLTLPKLKRRDTIRFLDVNDVVAVTSVVFAQQWVSAAGTTGGGKGGSLARQQEAELRFPSIGGVHTAPGQITLFDIVPTGQRSSAAGANYVPMIIAPLASSSAGSPRAPRYPASDSGHDTTMGSDIVVDGSPPFSAASDVSGVLMPPPAVPPALHS